MNLLYINIIEYIFVFDSYTLYFLDWVAKDWEALVHSCLKIAGWAPDLSPFTHAWSRWLNPSWRHPYLWSKKWRMPWSLCIYTHMTGWFIWYVIVTVNICHDHGCYGLECLPQAVKTITRIITVSIFQGDFEKVVSFPLASWVGGASQVIFYSLW